MDRNIGIVIMFVFILMACNNNPKSKQAPIDGNTENKMAEVDKGHPGKQLLESECYICHNPKTTRESMIAPPMAAVKLYYKNSTTSKKEFVEAFIAWVNDPQQESKMPWALKRFGSMPYVPYDDGTITQIAEYVYENDIEKPNWFQAKNLEEAGKEMDSYEHEEVVNYGQIGLEYARAAQAHLGKNLMKALQEKGTVGAIGFCKVEAMKLTDSISVMNNAVIKRVSDKPRNPENEANAEEIGYISYFKDLASAGTTPKPIVRMNQGEVNFYYPITTNAMCLQCHGKPNEEVVPETLAILQDLYPNDKALGYNANEVRGLWNINFDENSLE